MCALLQWEGYGCGARKGCVVDVQIQYGWGPGGKRREGKGREKANKDRNEGVRQNACVDAAQSVTHLDVLACLVAS